MEITVVYEDDEVTILKGTGMTFKIELTWEEAQKLLDELQQNFAKEAAAHKEARKEILTEERNELLEQLAKIDAKLQNL
jgi:predicted transcriptional regulator